MDGIHPLPVAARSKNPGASPLLALPFDVECAILDQVAHDFFALRACTLICREWASMAQQRLFRSVFIDLEPGTGQDSQNCDPKELRRFLDFLDGSPHIAKFVLGVTVHGGSVPSLSRFIRALISRTTRLRTLVVSFMTLDPMTVEQMPPLHAIAQDDGPSHRACLDRLEISWCEFNGAKPLFDILGLFSRIRQIRVWSCDAKSDVDAPDGPDLLPSSVPLIESVVLDTMHCDSPTVLQSVLAASSLPAGTLTAVRLKITRQTDIGGFLLPCLHGARDHLRKLHLDLDRRLLAIAPAIGLAAWNPVVDSIASCTVLESLTFAIEGKRQSRDRYMDYLRAVLPAYARLVSPPPPSVRSITFKVQEGDENYGWEDEGVKEVLEAIAEGSHWRTMDTEIADHRGLTQCAFVFYNREGHPAEDDKARIASTLQGVLPWMVKRGVLAVELKTPMDTKSWLYEI